jgi:hypothetical protein
VGDGILWLLRRKRWEASVTFARDIRPEELARRMGGRFDGAEAWSMTDAEVSEAV